MSKRRGKSGAGNGTRKQTARAPATTVRAPAAKSARTRTARPTWTAQANGNVSIRHREQFAEVYRPDPTQDYASVFGHRINPGNAAIFPWLAGIAPSWETYKFNSIRFEYIPSAPTTAAGTVVLAVDYDPTDPLPSVKRELLQMEGSTSAGIWVKQTHTSAKQNLNKRKELYVTTIGDPNRLNDLGTLIVGIFGTEDDYSFASTGDLWVSYDITLLTPQPRELSPDSYATYGTYFAYAADPATDLARASVFEDLAAGNVAYSSSLTGESCYPSPAGLTFPNPGVYDLEIRLFPGTSLQDGPPVPILDELEGVTFTPVQVVGQQTGTVIQQEALRIVTPDYVTGTSGTVGLQHKIVLKTTAPYSSFTYNLAAITTLCGFLYLRSARNSFLNTVANEPPLLPS